VRVLLFLLATLAIPSLAAPPDSSQVQSFAADYAHAVESKNVARIKAYFYPGLFVGLSARNQTVTNGWFTAFKSGQVALKDPVWITVTKLLPGSVSSSYGVWRLQPQYQVGFQSHHSVAGSEQGGPLLIEAIAEKDGHLYIVRPLPE
jgi:hypothetical protein